ncbi:hypothetical protein [Massilioclostridium coli]|uniref:hypothetical protein n=1 Tax=Massilioclostridium coli TaxID=1870991 RepID=UPI0013565100|nr:hypothetical protein [Massilioclostridium coli]
MKIILLITGVSISFIVLFCLWCCIRVGSLYDRERQNLNELNYLQKQKKEDP